MSEACCCKRPQTNGDKKAKKTILFVPLNCVGHVNSLISIADSLKHLGHRTVFLFNEPMESELRDGRHEVYDCSQEGLVPSVPDSASEKKWNFIVEEMGKLWRSTVIENFIHTTRIGLGMGMMQDIMKFDERVERKLQLIKPDLIVVDHYFIQPALIKYDKPWARVYSASPLALHPKRDRLPPATLGLPTDWLETKDPKMKSLYEAYAKQVDETKQELYDEFNEYLTKEHKLDPLPTDPMSYIYDSPCLNVYMYPEELDYSHLPTPKNWMRCDSILRTNVELAAIEENGSSKQEPNKTIARFEVPAQLKDKPGKLIFLSMGSLASGDTQLMKRLVEILAKAPHRFIVSMGINWDQYELADNMWGEKFLPQLAILPEVDLIITHGGNNTITECLYHGVPGFIVCPIFSDQYDNAQRIEEQKLGKRVDPFHCTAEDLLSAIEEVLGDSGIRSRMSAIKERMQKPENKFKAIRLFKDLVERV